MVTVRNRVRLESIKKDEDEKNTKQQSKLTFKGNLGSCTNYDSYIFKQNKVLMEKAMYSVLTI